MKNKISVLLLALIMLVQATPAYAYSQNIIGNDIIISDYVEITDTNQLFARAKSGINESNRTISAKANYFNTDAVNKKSSSEEQLLTTTQLLTTYLHNNQIVESYAVTVFADYSDSSLDPKGLMRLTLYFDAVGGSIIFRYSSDALLTTASFPSLVIANTVYEGMETGVAHTNSNVFPYPSGVTTLAAPTSLPIGGGLASLTAEARLNLFSGSYTDCIVSVI